MLNAARARTRQKRVPDVRAYEADTQLPVCKSNTGEAFRAQHVWRQNKTWVCVVRQVRVDGRACEAERTRAMHVMRQHSSDSCGTAK